MALSEIITFSITLSSCQVQAGRQRDDHLIAAYTGFRRQDFSKLAIPSCSGNALSRVAYFRADSVYRAIRRGASARPAQSCRRMAEMSRNIIRLQTMTALGIMKTINQCRCHQSKFASPASNALFVHYSKTISGRQRSRAGSAFPLYPSRYRLEYLSFALSRQHNVVISISSLDS